MKRRFMLSLMAAAAMACVGSVASAGTVQVTHDPNAPTSNFGSPGTTTAGASYSIQVSDDGTNYNVELKVTGDAASSAGDFANLYFDTDPLNNNGSDVGFEVENNRYFIPVDSGPTTYFDASPYLTSTVDSATHTIDVSIKNSFFTSGPQAGPAYPNGYPVATGDVVLRLSQSFGYSVAGGPDYGATRLGSANVAATPLPPTAWAGLVLMAGVGVATRLKRRQSVVA